MTTKNDYPYIQAWGEYIGYSQKLIDAEKQLARSDNAPWDATSKDLKTGIWMVADLIENDHTRKRIRELVKPYLKK